MAELMDILDQNRNKTGRITERSIPMKKGEYHLAVSVWIKNDAGEYLISKRSPMKKISPNMWETTGGVVMSGEDSLSAALREVREELGIELSAENGRIVKQYTYPHVTDDGAAHIDVWLFCQNVDINTVVLQKEETCDAMWANVERIRLMAARKLMFDYDYFDELIAFC